MSHVNDPRGERSYVNNGGRSLREEGQSCVHGNGSGCSGWKDEQMFSGATGC